MKPIERIKQFYLKSRPDLVMDGSFLPMMNGFWRELSSHPKLTIECVRKFIDKDWDWEELSSHPKLTLEFVREFAYKGWNWYTLFCFIVGHPIVD